MSAGAPQTSNHDVCATRDRDLVFHEGIFGPWRDSHFFPRVGIEEDCKDDIRSILAGVHDDGLGKFKL